MPDNTRPRLLPVLRRQFELLVGLGIQRVSSLLSVVLLCRYLPDLFGRYVFVMSLLDVAFMAIGFGSHTVMVRSVAQGGRPGLVYAAGAYLRLVTLSVEVPALLAAAALLRRESLVSLTAVMAVGLVANALA